MRICSLLLFTRGTERTAPANVGRPNVTAPGKRGRLSVSGEMHHETGHLCRNRQILDGFTLMTSQGLGEEEERRGKKPLPNSPLPHDINNSGTSLWVMKGCRSRSVCRHEFTRKRDLKEKASRCSSFFSCSVRWLLKLCVIYSNTTRVLAHNRIWVTPSLVSALVSADLWRRGRRTKSL